MKLRTLTGIVHNYSTTGQFVEPETFKTMAAAAFSGSSDFITVFDTGGNPMYLSWAMTSLVADHTTGANAANQGGPVNGYAALIVPPGGIDAPFSFPIPNGAYISLKGADPDAGGTSTAGMFILNRFLEV